MSTTNPLRHVARHSDREPTPIADLPRPALCARIQALRDAHDLLRDQSARDGGEGFYCVGTLKKELVLLQQALFQRDHPEARNFMPLPLEVALAMIGRTA